MGIAIGDDHLALAEAAARFLADRCPPEVVRAAVDAAAEERPPFWSELAGLGWLGLHIGEEYGGQGFGLSELAIVLEATGRAMAPGPFLPTVLAAALIERSGSDETRAKVLPQLVSGELIGAVAFSSGGPVLSGALADVVVAPVRIDGQERWCVFESAEFRSTSVGSLDVTRRLASIDIAGIEVPPDRQLTGLTRQVVDALVATVVAAECAGGAEWCVETAAGYARDRQQFGRPIGQFQGVKHRCADMLIATEQARAVAWDAAQADGGLASVIAGAIAVEAYADTAKNCIQVLGGIGFTWEHDAHLHLRRAMAMRQLLGGTARWRRAVATAALGGERRHLSVEVGQAGEGFRAEVRTAAERIAALPKDQRREALVDSGYFVPHWPAPWGHDAGAVEQLVISEELARARVRVPHLGIGAWAAPTIVVHGTDAQQERWVRPTLLGELRWCQLFSEPGAGSDLASLSTKAERCEGGWKLTGQKVWTTFAHESDWGICLARTNRSAPKHLGITYFIIDMKSEGIEVRPLREMTGLTMFNEVFLTDVFVPDDCVVGEVDGGWPLARTTLANERVVMSEGSSFGGGVEALLTLAASVEVDAEDRGVMLDSLGPRGRRRPLDRSARPPHRVPGRERRGARAGGERAQAPRCRARSAGAGGRARTARERRRLDRQSGGAAVDVRLPRQPVPDHRRRHERDPAQRHR